jgi:hypothetical protein
MGVNPWTALLAVRLSIARGSPERYARFPGRRDPNAPAPRSWSVQTLRTVWLSFGEIGCVIGAQAFLDFGLGADLYQHLFQEMVREGQSQVVSAAA